MTRIFLYNMHMTSVFTNKLFLLIAVSNLFILNGLAQEVGYNTGINKTGINPGLFQPVYGISIGYRFNSVFAIETNCLYSQRSIGSAVQADYLSFMAMPKIGYFGKKLGFYFAPALLLNPTLYHSNIENHTYMSTFQSLGAEWRAGKKLCLDVKFGYEFGLSGAYFENGAYKTYNGPLLLLGMKLVLDQQAK